MQVFCLDKPMNYWLRRLSIGIVLILLPLLTILRIRQSPMGAAFKLSPARIKGDPKARLTIYEYSDFQCPSCAAVRPAVDRLLELYQGKIRLAYKYNPLTHIHHNALSAAHAAQCAAEQNQFWTYENKLFTTQTQWAPLTDATTSFFTMAQEISLNQEQFKICYQDVNQRLLITEDMKEAENLDIHSTPTFIIGDDRLIGGLIESDGARVIEKALRNQ